MDSKSLDTGQSGHRLSPEPQLFSMTGGRGKAEVMSKAVNQAEEKSEALTAANVLGFRITDCPVEGVIVSGEERLAKWIMPILEKEGLHRKVAELQLSRTKHMNHLST